MVAHPYVNHVPVLTGGVGRRQLEHYYGKYFIPGMPPDVELVPISRTVGQNRIVDEFVFRCTHTVQMDWMLPGVLPTGRPTGVGHGGDCHLRKRQDPPRAHSLGPGHGTGAVGITGSGEATRGRVRDQSQGARPHGRTVEPTHEADDHRRTAVIGRTSRCSRRRGETGFGGFNVATAPPRLSYVVRRFERIAVINTQKSNERNPAMKSKSLVSIRVITTLCLSFAVAALTGCSTVPNAKLTRYEEAERISHQHLATFDTLDFDVYTNQKWDRLKESPRRISSCIILTGIRPRASMRTSRS